MYVWDQEIPDMITQFEAIASKTWTQRLMKPVSSCRLVALSCVSSQPQGDKWIETNFDNQIYRHWKRIASNDFIKNEFELDDVSTFVPKTNAANSMRIVATNADSKFIAGPPKIIQTENPVWHARKRYSALQANIGSNSATTCSLPCCLVMLCSSLVKKTKIRNQKGYTNSPPRHFFKKCPLRSPWTGPKRAHFKIHWGCLWQTSQISPSLSWIETVYHFLSSLSAAHPQHLHEFPLYSVWSHLIPPG